MNFVRQWSSRCVALLLLVAGTWTSVEARETTAPSLSFDITARVSSSERAGPQHDIKARVYLRGRSMRVEMKLAAQPTVLLLSPPYGYRLLPQTKTGVRYKTNSLFPEIERFAFSWKDMLASPQQIRHLAESKGAKKIGVATLNGTPTDIYAANRLQGRPAQIKFWLRRSDALPVRMESVEDGIKTMVNWTDYRRGGVASSLMVVPKDYHIRDGRPARILWQ